MAVQGTYGKISVFEDFNGWAASVSIADATAGTRYNDLTFIAISGAVDFVNTLDESGGVASFSGAGGAGDGICITSSPLVPSASGTIVMEARFKKSSITDLQLFAGWMETVSTTEPVMPFTLSGTTLTANNGGNVVGFYADSTATTDDFRFMAGLDGVALTTAAVYAPGSTSTTLGALGIRTNTTLTSDSWYIARVEINPGGTALGYFGHTTMAGGAALAPRLVARLTAENALDATALYYPVLILLDASTGDILNEVDYFGFTGQRDWAA